MSIKLSLTAAAVSILLAGHAGAAVVITGWNTSNVDISTASPGTAGESVIYDRSPVSAGARTSGKVTFDGSESDSPGLKIVNNAPPSIPASNGDVFNCVMANSPALCNSEKQSGKRFKFRRTAHEATDMVFDVDPNGAFKEPTPEQPKENDGLYKFFSAFGNDTGDRLSSFSVSLGTGVGAGFVPSGDDGLSFKREFTPGQPLNNSQFSALFANGLFGGIDEVHTITGYFSIDRAGFGLAFDGADRFVSTGLFGDYASLFGPMLSSQELPLGFFFDDDGDAETDNVLIAHQLADGTWRQNRAIDSAGLVTTIAYGNEGDFYGTEAELIAALSSTFDLCSNVTAGTECFAGSGAIDDLAKLNLTFFVDPTGYAGEEFTVRIESVPEPGSLALAALALGGLGAMRRRRA